MGIRKCIAIVNPRGGSRKGLSMLDDIKRSFSDAGVILDAHVTKHAGHAIQLAREIHLADYDCLCVVGGDGTVHDVVGGLMLRNERPDIPLGLIPAGTGNTLHQHLSCSDVGAAVAAILGGRNRWLDIIKVKSSGHVTYCVNIIGWGGMADINVKAEKLRMLGPSRYALASLWQIVQPIHRYAKLTLDGDVIEDKFQFVIACVTRSTGTGMLLAPQAEIDDGKVDVVILRKASRFQLLQVFRRVFDGSHVELPFVDYRQVRSFAIDADEAQLNMDGEVKGSSPFTAEVIPRAMRVMCNAKREEVTS
jgi:sphingosine kinase